MPMVSLIEQGWADQNDVARAFGYSVRTARRYQRRFEEGGLAALGRADGYPRGRARLAASRRRLVQQLKAQGHSNCEIARRLGVSEKAVRKTLRRLGWKSTPVAEPELPLDAGQPADANRLPRFQRRRQCLAPSTCQRRCGPKPVRFCRPAPPPAAQPDTDPRDRRGDRLLARLGLLDDAAPLFGSAPGGPARRRAAGAARSGGRAASSTAPSRSTAAWARPSTACAPRS